MSAPRMEPGRELDALVAEQVMGATWSAADSVARAAGQFRRLLGTPKATLTLGRFVQCWRSASGAMLIPDDGPTDNLAHYSTDNAAAMLVVAEVQRRHPGWRFMLLGGDISFGYTKRGPDDFVVDTTRREAFGWRASFFGEEDPTQNTGQRHADEWGETPALAICLAALACSAPLGTPPTTERTHG